MSLSNASTGYSYEKVLNFNPNPKKKPILTRKLRPNIIKSKDGCLSCKRRKKKCDEQKPICKACIRNELECKWPDHVILRPQLKRPQTTEQPQIIEQPQVQQVNNEQIEYPLQVITPEPIQVSSKQDFYNMDNDIIDSMFSYINDDFILDQFLDMKSQNIILTDKEADCTKIHEIITADPNENPQLSVIPGVKLSEHDLLCYNAFLRFLLDLLTFSHCHEEVSPSAIILPFIANNEIVREVALACGASWLGYSDKTFEAEAIRRYNNVLGLIIKELKDPKANYTDHIFVCVMLLQGLCMRNKNIGFNLTLCAAHFSTSYAIIKKRFLRNTLSHDNKFITMRPLTRLLMEIFIIFYPLNIMLCHSSKLKESVPSPFSFFGKFYHVLKEPINGYEDQNVWVNHPIIGAGLKSFAIATKCCWCCRFLTLPIPEDDLITYSSLLVETNNELKRLSQMLIDMPYLKPEQKENIYFTKSLLYASSIILRKLCYYDNTTIESLQDIVDLQIKQERLARAINPKGISSLWGLFIGASTASTTEQKKFFSETLNALADYIHSSICFKILKYLNIVWNDGSKDSHYEYVGFDFLFDTSVLDIISI